MWQEKEAVSERKLMCVYPHKLAQDQVWSPLCRGSRKCKLQIRILAQEGQGHSLDQAFQVCSSPFPLSLPIWSQWSIIHCGTTIVHLTRCSFIYIFMNAFTILWRNLQEIYPQTKLAELRNLISCVPGIFTYNNLRVSFWVRGVNFFKGSGLFQLLTSVKRLQSCFDLRTSTILSPYLHTENLVLNDALIRTTGLPTTYWWPEKVWKDVGSVVSDGHDGPSGEKGSNVTPL